MKKAFRKLFRSKKEERNKERSKSRSAFREANRASDTIKMKIDALESRRDDAWDEARSYLRNGDKIASRRSLQEIRADEIMISKLKVRKRTSDLILAKLETAITDKEFASALSDINSLLKIDSEDIDEALTEIQMKLGDQVDIDAVWNEAYREELRVSNSAHLDSIPSVDEMVQQLSDEIAFEKGHSSYKEDEDQKDTDAGSGRKPGGKDLKNDNKSSRRRAEKISQSGSGSLNSKWVMTKKPDTRLDDIAGMEEVKKLVKDRIITPFEHPEIWQRFKLKLGGGVLMYGPPGNGKTYIASAIAGELDAQFLSVKLSKIMSQWVGATEKHLTALFSEAKSYDRVVVFLDEVEALLAKRGSGSTIMDRAVPQFLAEVDGIEPTGNCLFLLGATNKPWMIDEAALRPGRFGNLIYVGLPDIEARQKIMLDNLQGIPVEQDVDIYQIASDLDDYSGADIAQICLEVKEKAANRTVSAKEEGMLDEDSRIVIEDFNQIISKRKPSVSRSMLKRYEKFQKELK